MTLRRFDHTQANSLSDVVESVYRDAYAVAIESGDPFESLKAAMDRFDSYVSNSEFDLVIAYRNDEAIGQAWGWPLAPDSGWWSGLDSVPEPDFTNEDGRRTFALSEIMVRKAYQGQGVARAMHDEILRGRGEDRATLLADAGNLEARRAYLRWGWTPVAQLRPGWPDSPILDVLILDLTERRS